MPSPREPVTWGVLGTPTGASLEKRQMVAMCQKPGKQDAPEVRKGSQS